MVNVNYFTDCYFILLHRLSNLNPVLASERRIFWRMNCGAGSVVNTFSVTSLFHCHHLNTNRPAKRMLSPYLPYLSRVMCRRGVPRLPRPERSAHQEARQELSSFLDRGSSLSLVLFRARVDRDFEGRQSQRMTLTTPINYHRRWGVFIPAGLFGTTRIHSWQPG